MEANQPKTPKRVTKRGKKGSRKPVDDDLLIDEFNSYGSSDYFFKCEVENPEEAQMMEDRLRERIAIEKNVENWLLSQGIFPSMTTVKKEEFFDERRQRVNSISYIVESDSTETSPNNKSDSPSSLSLSPQHSKLSRKRSNFCSLANLEIIQLSSSEIKRNSGPGGFCSEQKQTSSPILEEEESPIREAKRLEEFRPLDLDDY